jgi:hypothetical protein
MDCLDRPIQRTRLLVERQLEPWPEFLAALVIGSVATGEARPDSDVDCLSVFERLDECIVPAEFVRQPEPDAISTIFEVDADQNWAVQIDSKRVALADFFAAEWEDGLKHELSQAIVLFDREGLLLPQIAGKLHYSDEIRTQRVAALVATIEHTLAAWRVQSWLTRGGLGCAHEQLTGALEDVLQLLHAVNRVWLPWRNRWLISALKLPWLPLDFATRAQQASGNGGLSEADLWRRHTLLLQLYRDIRIKLNADFGNVDPEDTFARVHPELGHAYNMEA